WIAGRYVGFHSIVAVVCCIVAVRRLRGRPHRSEIRLRRRAAAQKPAAEPLRAVGAVLVEEISPPLDAPAPARRHHIILRPQFYREGTMPLRRPRPRPAAQPLLWKELYVDSALPVQGPARPLGAILLLCLVMSTCLIFLVSLLSIISGAGSGEIANAWTRVVGTAVACVLLLGVAVRAAGTFSGERD